MDQATLTALMKSYGAANTPENVNAITQRYSSDPTAAERRIYGLQGQSDESGGSRDLMLNKMIDQAVAQVAAPPVADPASLPVSPMVQNASAPGRRNANAGAPPSIQQREQYGPGGSDPLQREVNRNTPAMPNSRAPSAPASSGYEVDPQTSAMAPSGGLDWLLAALGLSAAPKAAAAVASTSKSGLPVAADIPEATYAGPMNTNIAKDGAVRSKTERIPAEGQAALPPPNAQLDNRAPSSVTGSPENEVLARKAQTQAEIDAANAEGESIQREMAKQARTRNWKPKGAVRNVTGRK